MKNFLFVFLCACFVFQGSAQEIFFNKKRSYKVEGYVLNGSDTINGWIAVLINNDELDYYSLSSLVTFIDSTGEQKKYKPGSIVGFGFREDEGSGKYISAGETEGLSKGTFLRKIVEGKISLFEEKLDRNIVRAETLRYQPFSQPSMMRKRDIHKSIFYVRRNNDALVKIKFNPKTDKLTKKYLKKTLDFLPDSFTDSDEEIGISGLIDILSDLNSKS